MVEKFSVKKSKPGNEVELTRGPLPIDTIDPENGLVLWKMLNQHDVERPDPMAQLW